MKRLADKYKDIIKYFVMDDTDNSRRNLYLCIFYASLSCIILIIHEIASKLPVYNIMVSAAYLLECLVLLYLAKKFGEYRRLVNAFCLFSNLVIFPLHCLLNGDVYTFAILYLVMGLILIIYLIEGVMMWIQLVLASVVDIAVIRMLYMYPELMRPYREAALRRSSKYLNFAICVFIPLFILIYQTIMHERMRDDILKDDAIIKRRDLSKSRFLANMTQEIRVPMNAIIGMNELILKEKLSAEEKEEAENIRDASNQLLRIVNDTLIYSRLASKRWVLENSGYSFYEMISSVLADFKDIAFKCNMDAYAFVDSKIPSTLYGDEVSIRQIFGFLLGNSLMQDARHRVCVDIRCERISDSNRARLDCRISESGNGLKEAEIEALLSAYKKYDTRQDSDIKGMGLEISICEELLKLMGGSLKIESIKDIGLSISFSFENYILDDTPMINIESPSDKRVLIYLHASDDENVWKPLFENLTFSPEYAVSALTFKEALINRAYTHVFVNMKDYNALKDIIKELGIEDKVYLIVQHKRRNDSFGAIKVIQPPISSIVVSEILNGVYEDDDHRLPDVRTRATCKNTRALLVEDSHINLKIMTGLIESFNIVCDPVTSGEKCLEFIGKNDYDIVFLDHRMPGMDGVETLKHIKDMMDKCSIPVVCITSDIGRNVRRNIIAEGFDECITKPLKNAALERILIELLPEEKMIYEDPYMMTGQKEERMKKSENAIHEYEVKVNPLEFDMNKGIENIGGDKDIYNEILLTYYNEAAEKIDRLPEYSKNDDLTLFTTSVHALKSSSASVGALGISELFRQFEMAGKAGDRSFIDQNLLNVIDSYRNLLTLVENYLTENGLLNKDDATKQEETEAEQIDEEKLKALHAYMDKFDLRNAEALLNEIAALNYESHINSAVKDIKNDFDMFEYFKAKDKIKDLIDKISK
ncbi:MAG: response regulator [Lachnospiraceae bacterium]|nr:response regulator [Lachnospiraceae bacterium]